MILRDPTVITAIFTFLTACVGATRWLLRVYFTYKTRDNLHKAQLDMTVEKFKATEFGKLVLAMKVSIEKIEPLVLEHTKILETFASAVQEVKQIESNMVTMMKELKIQYGNFTSTMQVAEARENLLLQKVNKIETEVIELKSGNIFVRTKK